MMGHHMHLLFAFVHVHLTNAAACCLRDLLELQDAWVKEMLEWAEAIRWGQGERGSLDKYLEYMHCVMSVLASGAAGVPPQRPATYVQLQIDGGHAALTCSNDACTKGPACKGNRLVVHKNGDLHLILEHHKTQLAGTGAAYHWVIKRGDVGYKILYIYAKVWLLHVVWWLHCYSLPLMGMINYGC